jgi:N-acetylglucosaminyldiphosphoundecaprenol N-acetyl-beta-D-mannosaminyltransferase
MAHYVPDSLSILGVGVSVFDSYADAVQLIHRRMSLRRRTFCVAVNPEKVYRANKDSRLRKVLESAHVQICDGVGVSLASRLLYGKRVPRCTGIDLFMRLVQLSADEGWKIFLLGASPETNEAACRTLADTFPGLKIAGRQDGYFDDSDAVVERINASGANLLFIGLGSPRQEFWISENMPRLRPSFFMGVGGSLDVVCGSARRAPTVFRKLGGEWLFRLLSQPRRAGRQMALPLFAFEVLKAALWGSRTPAKGGLHARASTF